MTQPTELQDFLAGRNRALRVFKSGPGTQAHLARLLLERGENVVVVVPGVRAYRELEALLELLSGGREKDRSVKVPAWEKPWIGLPPYGSRKPTAEEWSERWAALYSMIYGRKPAGILIGADNLLPKWPAPEILENSCLDLARGEEISPEMLLEQAVEWGYRRSKFVSGPGELAMRGDILDISAPGYELPLRLEFFGDTIEEIRLFDPASQKSVAGLPEAVILPTAPGIKSSKQSEAAKAFWKKLRTTGEISAREEQALVEQADRSDGFIWPGLFYNDSVVLDDYFPKKSVFVLSSASDLRARLEDREFGWREYLGREAAETGLKWPARFICRPEESARSAWGEERQAVFEDLTLGHEKLGVDLPENRFNSFSDLFWRHENVRRPWSTLVEGLREWGRSRRQTILSFRSERSRNKFLSLMEQEDGISVSLDYSLEGKGLFALISPLKKGMELAWNKVRILSEDILQPEPVKEISTRRDKTFEGLSSYDDLVEGDLLVHREYGLSRFGGLHHLKIGQVANDYLLLFFDRDDKLYLPVDRLKLVQRYKGPEGTAPALDQMGGSRWKRTTERVKKAIEKIAHDLVEMYAFRKVAKGFGYGPLDEMYRDFEATFGFEETPDQARAVRDVFRDMESVEPMDRLVCGDVGFGKTEIALRAAFRTVMEGRQVAMLCPTTVLAEQHYQNFVKRMEGFPIKVGMLSRFVSGKRQKTVLDAAARGEIDILIGTHRLLSKDVELPNLGLVVLDEEQRFGVKHKEKLKRYRKTVDVLTLTATPIPRTLQLSLSGVRGLSLIETPPVDRKPVETALLERDEEQLKFALKRELERGGQVFWVHNRVQGLEGVAEFVRSLAPDARIGMAHGQMSEKILEDTIHKFWHKELDILVTTAIIESGLDFPNANTLIVDQAQMFGLGQLYQLRGRVGRSERQAYAYFLVSSLDDIPETAKQRLRIILNMDYLGSGFRVAMEDLRLRGAGNILGEVQSGQIAKVGLDLFLELLEEEVRRIRGEASEQATEPEINFVFEAHIPGDYIPDPTERLRWYKALSSARNEAALESLYVDMRDRFGSVPDELKSFHAVLVLKLILSRLQACRADLFPVRASISWENGISAVSPEEIIKWVGRRSSWAKLVPPGKLELRYAEGTTIIEGLEFLAAELSELGNA